jgi:hypothetical protein
VQDGGDNDLNIERPRLLCRSSFSAAPHASTHRRRAAAVSGVSSAQRRCFACQWEVLAEKRDAQSARASFEKDLLVDVKSVKILRRCAVLEQRPDSTMPSTEEVLHSGRCMVCATCPTFCRDALPLPPAAHRDNVRHHETRLLICTPMSAISSWFGFSEKPAHVKYSVALYADHAMALWRSLGVRKAHLLCHDMGDSALLNGDILLKHASWRISQYVLQIPLLADVTQMLFTFPLFKAQVSSVLGKHLPDHELRNWYDGILARGGKRRLKHTIGYLTERICHEERWLHHLKDYAKSNRVQLIWGAEDKVAPLRIYNGLREILELNDARAVALSGLGHWLMAEDPDRFVEAFVKLMAL